MYVYIYLHTSTYIHSIILPVPPKHGPANRDQPIGNIYIYTYIFIYLFMKISPLPSPHPIYLPSPFLPHTPPGLTHGGPSVGGAGRGIYFHKHIHIIII